MTDKFLLTGHKTTAQVREEREDEKGRLKLLRRELEEEILAEMPGEEGDTRASVEAREKETSIPILDELHAKRVLEALLFVSPKPLTLPEIRKALRDVKPQVIERLLVTIKEDLTRQGHGFFLNEVAGGFEFATDPELSPWLKRLERLKRARLATQSALETVAILAYKQPVTRAEIEDIRGVDISSVLTTLLEKELIKITGRKEVPGRPFLYSTTEKFLQVFGLKSLQDLPPIEEIRRWVEGKGVLFGSQRASDTTPSERGVTQEAQTVDSEGELSADESGRTSQENRSSGQEDCGALVGADPACREDRSPEEQEGI